MRVRLDKTPASALPFMSASVEFDTGRADDALVIPVEALAVDHGRQSCYVLAEHGLEKPRSPGPLEKPRGPSEVTLAAGPGVEPRPGPIEVTEAGAPRICAVAGTTSASAATAAKYHARFIGLE